MDALESLTSPAMLAPFELPRAGVPALADALIGPIRRGVERALGLAALNELYRRTETRPERHFADRALAVLDVTAVIRGDAEAIPTAGPLIVVANHPFGGLDGLVLASLVARRRPDARLLANHLLALLPDLRRDLFLVDVFGGRRAVDRNRQPLKDAMRWVRQGGCLCVFPAGVVSHLDLRRRAVVDSAWHGSLGRLVHLTGARVVPCFIEGRNTLTFQLAGLVHPALRTLLLPRQLLNRRGTEVTVHVGAAVEASDGPRDGRRVAAMLRARTDALAPRGRIEERSPRRAAPLTFDPRRAVTLEVAAIVPGRVLARSDAYTVFWTPAARAPRLLQEIGRARERTFRAVGEGTGRELDLDAFDDRYLHLCVWDERAGQLVGAYRMMRVDSSERAPAPLYTQTLFRYDHALIDALAPALELGRAFVVPEYQKSYTPLMLLWTGIGRYVARHAKVRHLFGAVSIPSTYSDAARDVMIASLRRHAAEPRLAPLVTPRHPVEGRSIGAAGVAVPDSAIAQRHRRRPGRRWKGRANPAAAIPQAERPRPRLQRRSLVWPHHRRVDGRGPGARTRGHAPALHGARRSAGLPCTSYERPSGTPGPVRRWTRRMSVLLWSGRPAAERRVTWAELFFDLVFVAAVAQVGTPLAAHYSFSELGRYALLLFVIWWAWNGYAVYATRFDADDRTQRVLTLLQMVAVIFMAANAEDGLDSPSSAGFAAAYAVMRVLLVIQYLRASAIPDARRLALEYRGRLRNGGARVARVGLHRTSAPLRALGRRARHRLHDGGRRQPSHASAAAARGAPARALRPLHAHPARGIDRRDHEGHPVAAGLDRGRRRVCVRGPRADLRVLVGLFRLGRRHRPPARASRRDVRLLELWNYAHLPLYLGLALTGVGIEHIVRSGGIGALHGDEIRVLSVAVAVALASLAALHSISSGRDLESRCEKEGKALPTAPIHDIPT